MKDWFKVFWLRWKLRLFARDICRVHFCKMRLRWVQRGKKERFLNVCDECEQAKRVAEQVKKERKHWRQEEIEDACVEQRKKLGLPVTPTERAVDEITHDLLTEPQPAPQVWHGQLQQHAGNWGTGEGTVGTIQTVTVTPNAAPEGRFLPR